MAPRLRVLAGTSPSSMVPITHLVNTPNPHPIRSDLFEGEVVAQIQGLTDEQGRVRESEYFKREDRSGVTWSIVVRGRFLVPYSADDILFGNTFDRPLKLPWGTSAVLKFMHYIDPTLEHDLTSSTKPWALSPLISTMPHFMHTRIPTLSSPSSCPLSPFPTNQSIKDRNSELYLALADEPDEPDSASSLSGGSSHSASSSSDNVAPPSAAAAPFSETARSKSTTGSSSSSSGSSFSVKSAMRKVKRTRSTRAATSSTSSLSSDYRAKRTRELQTLSSASQRRSYFAQAARRQDVVFGPTDVVTTDFCYGFMSFAPRLALVLPGGLSFDLMRYWDGQPVRFVCCERVRAGEEGEREGREPWGRIFWCVAIEVVDGDDEDEQR